MNRLRLKSALRYQLITSSKALFVFIGVMVAVTLLLYVIGIVTTFTEGDNSMSFSGMGMAAAIMMLVMGIVSFREDFKMLLQNGCGRTTTFLSNIIAALYCGLVLVLASELFWLITGAFSGSAVTFQVGDFHTMFYGDFHSAYYGYSAQQLFPRILLNLAIYLLLWQGGLFFSLVYYRLSKFGKIIFTFIIIALLTFGLPMLASHFGATPLLNFFTQLAAAVMQFWANPYNLVLTIFLGVCICLGVNWLLLRRAQVVE